MQVEVIVINPSILQIIRIIPSHMHTTQIIRITLVPIACRYHKNLRHIFISSQMSEYLLNNGNFGVQQETYGRDSVRIDMLGRLNEES